MKTFKALMAEATIQAEKPPQRGILLLQDPTTKAWRMDRLYNTLDDAKAAGEKFKTDKGFEIKIVSVPSRQEEMKKDAEKRGD